MERTLMMLLGMPLLGMPSGLGDVGGAWDPPLRPSIAWQVAFQGPDLGGLTR